ncbi:hypothetical protein E0F15_22930 [Frankia sp. B2]|nr:hypothetical protein E0F15_22930 [Frankia sp. B2]
MDAAGPRPASTRRAPQENRTPEPPSGDKGGEPTGAASQATRCQAAPLSRHSCTGRRSWTSDPGRLEAAGVPEDVAFATKPTLARQMIEQALD